MVPLRNAGCVAFERGREKCFLWRMLCQVWPHCHERLRLCYALPLSHPMFLGSCGWGLRRDLQTKGTQRTRPVMAWRMWMAGQGLCEERGKVTSPSLMSFLAIQPLPGCCPPLLGTWTCRDWRLEGGHQGGEPCGSPGALRLAPRPRSAHLEAPLICALLLKSVLPLLFPLSLLFLYRCLGNRRQPNIPAWYKRGHLIYQGPTAVCILFLL